MQIRQETTVSATISTLRKLLELRTRVDSRITLLRRSMLRRLQATTRARLLTAWIHLRHLVLIQTPTLHLLLMDLLVLRHLLGKSYFDLIRVDRLAIGQKKSAWPPIANPIRKMSNLTNCQSSLILMASNLPIWQISHYFQIGNRLNLDMANQLPIQFGRPDWIGNWLGIANWPITNKLLICQLPIDCLLANLPIGSDWQLVGQAIFVQLGHSGH